MKDKLLLHPTTEVSLTTFASKPGHALLLTGPMGAGKETLSRAVAAELLGVGLESLATQAYFKEVRAPEGKIVIPIEAIRELQNFMSLKTIGHKLIKRIALIHGAENLQTPAQNALLKLLEEPPSDSLLILTATDPGSLLPTVRSRVQHIVIKPVTLSQSQKFFEASSQLDIQRASLLSGGYVGLMHSLLPPDTAHPMTEALDTGKQLLTSSYFERLLYVDKLGKDKQLTINVIDAMQRTAKVALTQAAQKNAISSVKKWHNITLQLQSTHAALAHNAQTKLVLTNLFLHL